MAKGGVYDQLGGGFHRYSVDERWVVPHFEKMSYDNSELLKNYVHAYQATGTQFFAEVARDIIRWLDEWLSDREKGGFYASQDADYSMEDDGDYFTWTLGEAQAVLTEDEAKVASLHYDINEVGEMHHNPAKNVLYVRASVEEIAKRLDLRTEQVRELLETAKKKMYRARLKRPTPYVDKTIYVGWNALCISAYLQAARVLNLVEARRFALRSLDRILAEAWQPECGLKHVLAYSDPQAEHRDIPGLLCDYGLTAVACLDAYEIAADISYFNFGKRIVDLMIDRVFDPIAGGFFDTASGSGSALGVLGARRKPFQDSPTPAGNSMAAIALLRMHAYTNDESYWKKAEQTIEVLAGVAGQYGIFAATYGIAAVLLSEPHTQVVVIGDDKKAEQLTSAAAAPFTFSKAVIKLTKNEVAAQNLPPALAQTIPRMLLKNEGSVALICSEFACRAPVSEVGELQEILYAGRK